ncbi:hypothetical protein FHS89_002220 [Rubricella aquisinus]|uniref:Uncharacterized protein n=1 Tax=Rubricella aquisinus TaxID=2028108 RepID=A0A840X0E3_9RHOB|nr:hypothetical protein [Rubricella aquisinus]MBB5516194.1 hypothetical protein [Rubricella aquisinus]
MAPRLTAILGLVAVIAGPASGQEVPRSAISWIPLERDANAAEAPTGPTVQRSTITSEPLIGTRRDAVGLVPARALGLPPDIWGISSALRISRMLDELNENGVPATRGLLHRLLLVEAIPPRGSGRRAIVLNARIDALMRMGAVDEAEALGQRAGPPDDRLFERLFDIALLTGRADAACKMLAADATLSDDLSTRVFCAARSGQWDTAAMTLGLGEALGAIAPLRADHLRMFLDPDLFEDDTDLDLPEPMTALDFALREAAGQSRPRADLPPAFLYRDIHGRAPVRDRALAAERLSREGDFPYPILFAAYRARTPAASGSVWDRMAHVQTLDAVLGQGEATEDILPALRYAYDALAEVDLTMPLALEYGAALSRLIPPAEGDLTVAKVLMLAAQPAPARDWLPDEAPYPHHVALLIAEGSDAYDTLPPAPALPGDADRLATAALEAFALPMEGQSLDPQEARLEDLLRINRNGEAVLSALDLLGAGVEVDPGDLRAALRTLRGLGLEEDARRIAVQTILLRLP